MRTWLRRANWPVCATQDWATYRKTSYFGSLDGLRCLAILAVVWAHTGVAVPGLALADQGPRGVDLFFVISGFLITTLLLRERERCGDISLRAFFARRALRIFPLYYAVLALYVLVVGLVEPNSEPGRDFWGNLPYFLTYTSNWFVPLEGRVIFYFAWSLATEEQFYLLWPALERLCRGWRVAWVVGGLLLLRYAVGLGIETGALDPGSLGVIIVRSIHPAILGGVLLAHLLHDARTFRVLAPVLGWRFAAPIALVGLLATMEVTPSRTVLWPLMVALVGCVAIREANGLAPLLRWRPIAHIGAISYGMYLLHMLSYHAAQRGLGAVGLEQEWLHFPATVLVAGIAATLSHRYYESWFLQLKDAYARGAAKAPPELPRATPLRRTRLGRAVARALPPPSVPLSSRRPR